MMEEKIEVRKETRRSRKQKFGSILKKAFKSKITYVIIAILLIIGAYFLGSHQGAQKQKKADEKAHPSAVNASGSNPASQNRWTSVGTVQDISATSITVKDSRGETKQAKIESNTAVVDSKAAKTNVQAIKKDQKVIISGTKDDKGNLTATRIRIQQ